MAKWHCDQGTYIFFRKLDHNSMVSCQKGPTHLAYAWQIGPFWQDTLESIQIMACFLFSKAVLQPHDFCLLWVLWRRSSMYNITKPDWSMKFIPQPSFTSSRTMIIIMFSYTIARVKEGYPIEPCYTTPMACVGIIIDWLVIGSHD